MGNLKPKDSSNTAMMSPRLARAGLLGQTGTQSVRDPHAGSAPAKTPGRVSEAPLRPPRSEEV